MQPAYYSASAILYLRKFQNGSRSQLTPYVFFFFGLAIYRRTDKFPLRWSDAYRLNSDYKASLSLNPFQSFFSSLKFRKTGFDIQKTK
jgi:hypothetical protein